MCLLPFWLQDSSLLLLVKAVPNQWAEAPPAKICGFPGLQLQNCSGNLSVRASLFYTLDCIILYCSMLYYVISEHATLDSFDTCDPWGERASKLQLSLCKRHVRHPHAPPSAPCYSHRFQIGGPQNHSLKVGPQSPLIALNTAQQLLKALQSPEKPLVLRVCLWGPLVGSYDRSTCKAPAPKP